MLSILNAAIAACSVGFDAVRSAADINRKLERMVDDPEPVYLSRGTLWNATLDIRSAADDVWRRRLRDHGKTAVVVLPRADCREIEVLAADIQRCAPPGTRAPAERN